MPGAILQIIMEAVTKICLETVFSKKSHYIEPGQLLCKAID